MRYAIIATLTVLGFPWLATGDPPVGPAKSDGKVPEGSKEQAAIKAIIERGGKHWSSPPKATIGGKEHQPGQNLFIWPAEDKIYPSARTSDRVHSFGVKYNWALQPGASLPPQKTGQYYQYAPAALPKTFGWDFTKRFDERAKSGTFDVLLGAEIDKLKGEQDIIFAIFVNARETVPASNFVKVRVRLPD